MCFPFVFFEKTTRRLAVSQTFSLVIRVYLLPDGFRKCPKGCGNLADSIRIRSLAIGDRRIK